MISSPLYHSDKERARFLICSLIAVAPKRDHSPVPALLPPITQVFSLCVLIGVIVMVSSHPRQRKRLNSFDLLSIPSATIASRHIGQFLIRGSLFVKSIVKLWHAGCTQSLT